MGRAPVRVLAFVSEILSAKTLVPIIRALRLDERFVVRIVNDGFCKEFVESLGLPVTYILDHFEAKVDPEVHAASVVLMGKSYVQPSEYDLLRRAARWGVPVLMVVPDMGIDIVRAKLRGIGDDSNGAIPWPKFLVADPRTRASMRSLNIPDDRIAEFGNPYFDELYFELNRDHSDWEPVGIGYFSTPFELDFKRGILPANYRQSQLITDIHRVCREQRQPLIGKRHPQVDPKLFKGMTVFDGTPLEMIRTIRVAIGSYSTTLLEAFAAGIPAISYQPWEANIRQDVFENRIPIVKTASELKASLSQIFNDPHRRRATEHVTYNPGSALCVALDQLDELLASLGSSAERK